MRKRNHPYDRASADISSEPAPFQWFYLILTIVCAAFLAAGFFFAARQHFLAMELGIKNSNLRKQIDDLQGEQRRLVLSREIVMSPMAVKRIARSKGFGDVVPQTVAAVASATRANNTPGLVVKTVSAEKTQGKANGTKPLKAFFPLEADTQKAKSGKIELKVDNKNESRVSRYLVARSR